MPEPICDPIECHRSDDDPKHDQGTIRNMHEKQMNGEQKQNERGRDLGRSIDAHRFYFFSQYVTTNAVTHIVAYPPTKNRRRVIRSVSVSTERESMSKTSLIAAN